MKTLLMATAFAALALSPASAKMMACTGDNMGKTAMSTTSMPDGPARRGMDKEMAAANTDMSMGKMRSACMHYMKAQQMSSAK